MDVKQLNNKTIICGMSISELYDVYDVDLFEVEDFLTDPTVVESLATKVPDIIKDCLADLGLKTDFESSTEPVNIRFSMTGERVELIFEFRGNLIKNDDFWGALGGTPNKVTNDSTYINPLEFDEEFDEELDDEENFHEDDKMSLQEKRLADQLATMLALTALGSILKPREKDINDEKNNSQPQKINISDEQPYILKFETIANVINFSKLITNVKTDSKLVKNNNIYYLFLARASKKIETIATEFECQCDKDVTKEYVFNSNCQIILENNAIEKLSKI